MAVRQRGAGSSSKKQESNKPQSSSKPGSVPWSKRQKGSHEQHPARFWLKALSALLSLVCLAYVTHSLYFNQTKQSEPPFSSSGIRETPKQEVLKATVRSLPTRPVFDADEEKLNAVLEAFDDSWAGYVKDAFGFDEYHPLSQEGSNFSKDGGVGYFIVDVLDMLLLTEREEEYQRARDWIRNELKWSDKSGKFSVFEVSLPFTIHSEGKGDLPCSFFFD